MISRISDSVVRSYLSPTKAQSVLSQLVWRVISSSIEGLHEVGELGVCLLQLLTFKPVHQDLEMGSLSGSECGLCLLTTLLLKLPSVISIEIDHSSAREAVLLADHVAEVDVGVGLLGVGNGVSTMVETVDGSCSQVVGRGHVTGLFPVVDRVGTATQKDVDGDLRVIIDKVLALRNDILNVDIRCS